MLNLFLGIRPPIEARYAAQAPAPPTRGGRPGTLGISGRLASEQVAG